MKLKEGNSSPLFNAIVSTLMNNEEKSIKIKDEIYTVYWTPHSCVRAEQRMKIDLSISINELIQILKEIDNNTTIKLNTGYTVIRDFLNGVIYILHINNEQKKIRCITCGDVYSMFPYDGDMVIQRNMNYGITSYFWKRK
ncbi:MAG: hypothetical protein IJT36_01765 [Alphaproteobacteria bacterium]|nr:hypothetical protein [Alphaproteobacteria bacterium]